MEDINNGISVFKMLKQILDLIKQKVDSEFKDTNLTGTQGMIVGTLAHNGEMKISELSEKMCLSNSTVSGILDRLEQIGYVERKRSKEDRRVVYVDITPEFKKKSKCKFDSVEKRLDSLLDKATPEEIIKIYEGLKVLRDLFDR